MLINALGDWDREKIFFDEKNLILGDREEIIFLTEI